MAKARTFDFTGVEDRAANFRPKRKPEGDYYAHIRAVDDHESKEGNEGWVFTITIDGDARSSYPYYVMFDDKQAWKPRALCIAAGQAVPSKRVKLNPNILVGKAIGVALADDEYEGRVKSTIDGVFPLDDISDAQNQQAKASSSKAKSKQADEDDEDEDDEDEEPAPKKGGKGKASSKKKSPEPDDDEDEDDDDEDDEPPAKSKSKSKAKGKKRSEPEDDDEDDEDDDEEEEPPAKKKSKSAPTKSKSKKSKKRDEDDEDDELDLDDL